MKHKSRISLDKSVMESVMALSEGNPGALTVILEMMKMNTKIDPDDCFQAVGPLLSLDQHGIYGSRIWMLHKDVCGQEIGLTLGLLRAVQMGVLSEEKLNHAIDNRGDGFNVKDVVHQLMKELPNFNPDAK